MNTISIQNFKILKASDFYQRGRPAHVVKSTTFDTAEVGSISIEIIQVCEKRGAENRKRIYFHIIRSKTLLHWDLLTSFTKMRKG